MGFEYLLIMLLAGVAIYLASQSMTRVRELQSEMRLMRQQMQKNYDELLTVCSSVQKGNEASDAPTLPEQTTGRNEAPADAIPLAQSHNNPMAVHEKDIAHAAEVVAQVQTNDSKPALASATVKAEDEPPKASKPAAQKMAQSAAGFEQRFAARLPVWLGGIALAFAGFFMARYSLEHGLISPKVRMFFSFLFAAGLVFAGDYVRKKGTIANGVRIAQALSGAGIAALYGCFYASAHFYNFIPTSLAFVGMAGVTATAVILSLRHGAFIALLGLAGGFLTPALFGSNEPNAPALFFYLYGVFAGLIFATRKNGWWLVSVLAVLASFGWVLLWLGSGHFNTEDSLALGLFLLAVCGTAVFASQKQYEDETVAARAGWRPLWIFNYLALGGALILWGMITTRAGFGALEWGLLFVLSAGSVTLAFFKPQLYKPFPCMALAASAVLLLLWNADSDHAFMLVLALFAALFVGGGYVLQSRSEKPVLWAALCCIAALVYYLIGLKELWDSVLSAPYAKGSVALLLATAATGVVGSLVRAVPEDHADKQKLLAFYAATATAFLALASVLELPTLYLPLAFAVQCLALAWLDTRFTVKALRVLAVVMAALFLLPLLHQVTSILNMYEAGLLDNSADVLSIFAVVAHPLIIVGLPAALFGVASIWLRRRQDDAVVMLLESLAMALAAVAGYLLIRHAFHDGNAVLFAEASFIERGVTVSVFFLLGAVCLWLGQMFKRQSLWWGGVALYGAALFRIMALDILLFNPLWSMQYVGEWWLLNGLLLTYGLPVLWCGLALRFLKAGQAAVALERGVSITMMVLGLLWVSLNVRQMYQGAYLNSNQIANAEIYTYSAAWLLMGVALLFLGTVKKSQMLRFASMGIIMLTIGKVFLYDASALDGLLRVFSFLGLGVCLLGVSWFYTRFVFGEEKNVEG